MSAAEAPLRTPSLADTFADMDRRTRALEYGDTHSLREQLGNLEERIHDYVDYLLGTVMNDLYSNDTGAYNWCVAYSNNITAWAAGPAGVLPKWSKDFTEYWVRMHEQSYHAIPNPIPGPGNLTGPVVPTFWPVTYPDIPDSMSETRARAVALAEQIEAATLAATEAAIAAHEHDHPPPEGTP